MLLLYGTQWYKNTSFDKVAKTVFLFTTPFVAGTPMQPLKEQQS